MDTQENLLVSEEHLSAAQALLANRRTVTVLAAMSPQQPDALMRAILVVARRQGVQLRFLFADVAGRFAFLDELAARDIEEGRLRITSLAGAIHRRWARVTDYLPYSLWDIDRMLGSRTIPFDIVVARVRLSAEPGYVEFGDMVGYTPSALASGATAAFEIEGRCRSGGFPGTDPLLIGRADIVIPANPESSAERLPSRTTSENERIGRLVASLVPDASTLQLGIGSVSEALVPHLEAKRELGLHSGILMPSLRKLIKSGVIGGSAKSRDVRLAVATGIFGLRDSADEDWGGSVRLRPISATHDPQELSGQQRFWAINSALQIDLAGQVNAEYVDGQRIASGGGQSDFARAAHLSRGGASVIALACRARDGRSRIVSRLPASHLATLAGQDVDFVVTEHGIAALRGLTAWEKAAALVAVADPDDRLQLHRSLHEDRPAFASAGLSSFSNTDRDKVSRSQ